MSDIQDLRGNIELKKIEAPSLTQSNYGKNIREKFDNIDDNLRRLANRDFVAGKAGKDIKFTKYPLWSDNDFTDLGRAFVQAIVGDEPIDWEHDWNASNSDFTNEFYDNHTSLRPVGVKFFDYFIENPDITIMYQLDDHEAPDEEINRILICSPYVYTFIDKRYAVLGDSVPSNPDVYSDLKDNSCLLNLTYNGEYPQLERINQFPTLYYDGNGQFRWKLYGSESGILATGPKGTDANSAPITFARLSTVDNGDNTATALSSNTVSQILVINTDGTTAIWKEVSDLEDDEFPNIGDPVIAYRPMTSQEAQDPALIGQPYTVYFTKVINVERDAKVITVCDASSTSIQFLVDNTMLDSMLKTIRDGSMGTACLYIPTIGSLQRFSDDTVVHAAIGTQQEQSGESHYYLTLKPIKYKSEEGNKGVHNPEEAESITNSELIIEYDKTTIKKVLEVDGNLEVRGSTKLLQNLDVSGNVSISNNLKSLNAEITNTLKTNTIENNTALNTKKLKVTEDVLIGTNSRGVQIGGSGTNKDRIVLYSNDDLKSTTLTSEGITTDGSVTARVNKVPGVYLGCPIGTIVMWVGTTAPLGWLICDGEDIGSRTELGTPVYSYTEAHTSGYVTVNVYPKAEEFRELCNILKDTYGKFCKLPDLRQKFPLGALADGTIGNYFDSSTSSWQSWGTDLGSTGGEDTTKLYASNLPNHKHSITTWATTQGTEDSVEAEASGGTQASAKTDDTIYTSGDLKVVDETPGPFESQRQNLNNIPPFLAINFIIKYQ